MNHDAVRLKVIKGEQRSDDLGASYYPPLDNSYLSLFLMSEQTSPNGYMEKYHMSDEQKSRIKMIRTMIANNPKIKDEVINIIKSYIPMDYDNFKILLFGDQKQVISNINSEAEPNAVNELKMKIEDIFKNGLK